MIQRYPTEVQVLSYMSQMSRSRQRECLAQRGKRRAGGQKGSVRNYVAEMGNNLWPRKYPAFAKLEAIKQKQFWSVNITAGENRMKFATKVLEGTKYIDMKCSISANIKLADCDKFGLCPCCFKEKCTPGLSSRGPVTCDASNFFMGGDGQLKPSRNIYQNSLAPRKRTRGVDDDKSTAMAEKASKATVAIRSVSRWTACRRAARSSAGGASRPTSRRTR